MDSELRAVVETQIRDTLRTSPPSIALVAGALGMSGRTLQRRLAADKLQFADLVDAVRRDVALMLVREPELSVHDIGVRLGYRDAQSFRNAFVRWTGVTPRAYRARRG